MRINGRRDFLIETAAAALGVAAGISCAGAVHGPESVANSEAPEGIAASAIKEHYDSLSAPQDIQRGVINAVLSGEREEIRNAKGCIVPGVVEGLVFKSSLMPYTTKNGAPAYAIETLVTNGQQVTISHRKVLIDYTDKYIRPEKVTWCVDNAIQWSINYVAHDVEVYYISHDGTGKDCINQQ